MPRRSILHRSRRVYRRLLWSVVLLVAVGQAWWLAPWRWREAGRVPAEGGVIGVTDDGFLMTRETAGGLPGFFGWDGRPRWQVTRPQPDPRDGAEWRLAYAPDSQGVALVVYPPGGPARLWTWRSGAPHYRGFALPAPPEMAPRGPNSVHRCNIALLTDGRVCYAVPDGVRAVRLYVIDQHRVSAQGRYVSPLWNAGIPLAPVVSPDGRALALYAVTATPHTIEYLRLAYAGSRVRFTPVFSTVFGNAPRFVDTDRLISNEGRELCDGKGQVTDLAKTPNAALCWWRWQCLVDEETRRSMMRAETGEGGPFAILDLRTGTTWPLEGCDATATPDGRYAAALVPVSAHATLQRLLSWIAARLHRPPPPGLRFEIHTYERPGRRRGIIRLPHGTIDTARYSWTTFFRFSPDARHLIVAGRDTQTAGGAYIIYTR